MNLAVLTTSTHHGGDSVHFNNSLKKFGWPPAFPCGFTGSPPETIPIQMVKRVRDLASHVLGLREVGFCTHFVHLDAWDMLATCGPDEFVKSVESFSKPIVFSAERNCYPYPDKIEAHPQVPKGHHRFLNAGGFVASIEVFCELIEKYDLANNKDEIDQGVYMKMFLDNQDVCELDHAQKLWLSMYLVSDKDITMINNRVRYNPTGEFPIFIHGNAWQGHKKFIPNFT